MVSDTCEYKTKTNKCLRVHNTKIHSEVTKESDPYVWVWYDENGEHLNCFTICGLTISFMTVGDKSDIESREHFTINIMKLYMIINGVIECKGINLTRYNPLRGLTSSSCDLWLRLFPLQAKKGLSMLFLLILGNFWCLILTSATFSSNQNLLGKKSRIFEKI